MPIALFQEKQLSTFTQVMIGLVGGPAPTIYGRIRDFTPPGRERESLDVPELRPTDSDGVLLPGDAQELGDEVLGEFQMSHYHRWNHPQAQFLDTAFDNNSELQFELRSAHADTPAKMEFRGRVRNLAPAQQAKGEYYVREVTFVRTSAITISDV
jgi:hypothetical protein